MTAQLPIVYTPDAVAAHLGVSERTLPLSDAVFGNSPVGAQLVKVK